VRIRVFSVAGKRVAEVAAPGTQGYNQIPWQPHPELANGTYLFSLPGSTGACKDAWDEILIHQLDIRHRPCNFAELIPRLRER
jgi:hypothetical protein